MPPGRGSAAGWKFSAPPYYSQSTVFASPLSTFSFMLQKIMFRLFSETPCIITAGVGTDPRVGGRRSTTVPWSGHRTHHESSQAAQTQSSYTGGDLFAASFFLCQCVVAGFFRANIIFPDPLSHLALPWENFLCLFAMQMPILAFPGVLLGLCHKHLYMRLLVQTKFLTLCLPTYYAALMAHHRSG